MISLSLLSQPGETHWILVANGSKGAVYTTHRVDRQPAPNDPESTGQITLRKIDGLEFKGEDLGRYDLNRRQPARVEQSGTRTPSMSEKKETAQDHVRHNLAVDIAETLNERSEKNEFTHLVLVASPSVLSDIKTHLSKRANERVIASHAADLTHYDGNELLARLNHLAQPGALAS